MKIIDQEKLLLTAKDAAQATGDLLKSFDAKLIKSWGKDVKIDADEQAHKTILKILKGSDIPVLSEEDGDHDFDLELKWIVDPIDGSINFLRGISLCAVSVGLIREEEPILGVVYDFNREEMFSGIVGKGVWLNGKDISVSSIRERGEAIIMTGFPSYTDYSTESLKEYISKIQSFKKVRLFGSAALSLAYVACGRVDAYYEKDIKIWDVAAGLALVKAAGGKYTKTKVGIKGKCTVFAGNKHVYI